MSIYNFFLNIIEYGGSKNDIVFVALVRTLSIIRFLNNLSARPLRATHKEISEQRRALSLYSRKMDNSYGYGQGNESEEEIFRVR